MILKDCERIQVYQIAIKNIMSDKKTLLIAPRGAGKTYFLMRLQNKLKKLSDALTIYVKPNYDFSSNFTWVKKLLNLIVNDLKRRGAYSKNDFSYYLLDKISKTRNPLYLELLKEQVQHEYGFKIVFLLDDLDYFSNIDLGLLQFVDIATTSRVSDFYAMEGFELIQLKPFNTKSLECFNFEYEYHFEDVLDPFLWQDIIDNFSGIPVYFTQTLSVIYNLKGRGSPIDRSIVRQLRQDREYMSNLYRIAESFYRYYKTIYGEKIDELLSIAIKGGRTMGLKELVNIRFREFLDMGLIDLKKKDERFEITFVDKILLDWYKSTRYQVSLLSPQKVYRIL